MVLRPEIQYLNELELAGPFKKGPSPNITRVLVSAAVSTYTSTEYRERYQ